MAQKSKNQDFNVVVVGVKYHKISGKSVKNGVFCRYFYTFYDILTLFLAGFGT